MRRAEPCARLDLTELADKLPEEISGGQAQRVAVARVLASRPALIFADEPTSQLDRGNGAHVIDVLLETADATGAALVSRPTTTSIAERFATRWTLPMASSTTRAQALGCTSMLDPGLISRATGRLSPPPAVSRSAVALLASIGASSPERRHR